MELEKLRLQIDAVDAQLLELFAQRLTISEKIAAYKQENHMPIHIPQREAEKLEALQAQADPVLRPYIAALYDTIFRISRAHQQVQP